MQNYHLPIESIENRSRPSGSVVLLALNNYATQVGRVRKNSTYLLYLSLNEVLRYKHQLKTLPLSFVKNTLLMLKTLGHFGLKLKTHLLVVTPLPRFSRDTWEVQKAEIKRLEGLLEEKHISYLDSFSLLPAHIIEEDYYSGRDQVHYSRAVREIVAKASAKELEKYMNK